MVASVVACSSATPVPSIPSISRPRIVAHRGASYAAPENTMAAFRRAWALGTEAIELDVRLSRDGAVVVIHDDDTGRVTDVAGAVADQTLVELRILEVGRSQGYAGERIPTLAEVLAEVPAGRSVVVEIKTGLATVDAVAAVIRPAQARGVVVLLQAYDPEVLAALARATGAPAYWTVDPPTGALGQILGYPARVVDEAVARGFVGLALDHRGIGDALLARARAAGLIMDVWTVNDTETLRAWLVKDVRWIETDRPDLVP